MKRLSVSLVLTLLSFHLLYASHLRAGDISVNPANGCGSLTYRITLTLYVNTSSPVKAGGDGVFLDFGDGQSINVPELNSTVLDPGLNVGVAKFSTTHTYASPGHYTVSYEELARNAAVLNIPNSISLPFYVETSFTASLSNCLATPESLTPPVDRACSGLAFYYDAAAPATHDSLTFELVTPMTGVNQPAADYHLPDDPEFYGGLNYTHANEAHDGKPKISIDPVTGILTWDAPGATGEYTIDIKITQWVKDPASQEWVQAGYVIRDMQIIVEDCSNKRPVLNGPDQVCASPTHPVDFTVTGSDPDMDSVYIETFSTLLDLPTNPAVASPQGSVLQSASSAHVDFTWNPDCSSVQPESYLAIFKISDHPAMGPPLVDFKNVYITVTGDPPAIQSLTYNPITKQNKLQWHAYPCNNTDLIQVWRRVAKYNYIQPDCEYGMPSFLHYDLIAQLPASATSYIDKDVVLGPQYCYRVLALIGDDQTPSRLSLDTCIIPSPVRPPVITNVSVVTTEQASGHVQITWTSPRDIDPAQYPPPYTYELFRHSANDSKPTSISSAAIVDTTFLDKSANTHDSVYYYQVMLHVPKLSPAAIDSSGTAGTVRLEKTARLNGIELAWSAVVPWSNFIQGFPYHYVYRSTTGKNGSFQEIDSVNVVEDGATYFDKGPLVAGQRYYYKVETAGSYGNPALPHPLLNFSQITDTPLLDTIPPCSPALTLEDVDCSSIPCDQSLFSNTLHWTSCGMNTDYYRVYAATNPDSAFTLIADHILDISYTDSNLPEQARCYKVEAVSEFNIVSDFSNMVIAENCTGFKMPNVFTPHPADDVNDTFEPFGVVNKEKCPCNTDACYRSVTSMSLKVYDRWGKLIFWDASSNGTPVSWSGKDNDGRESAAGTYYYDARVNFRLTSWKQESKIYKGWVQLLR